MLRKTARVKNLDDAIRLHEENPTWDIISTEMDYVGELIYDERRNDDRCSIEETTSANKESEKHSSACSERTRTGKSDRTESSVRSEKCTTRRSVGRKSKLFNGKC